MAVTVKSEKQIALMREAGRLLAITHEELHKALKPGMTTLDIDRLGEEIIRDFGCVPNFKNYNGFPASQTLTAGKKRDQYQSIGWHHFWSHQVPAP